jgi:hypothetical protein
VGGRCSRDPHQASTQAEDRPPGCTTDSAVIDRKSLSPDLGTGLGESGFAATAVAPAPLLFSQSPTATPDSAVHISGSISQCGKIVPGVFVRFFEGNAQHAVKANDAGVYEVDLPFGIWTATTGSPPSSPTASAVAKQSLSRSRHFALSAPGRLFLDLQLRPPVICDVATSPGGESGRDAVCWGEEFFPVPSSDGVPLEVDLFGLVTSGAPRQRQRFLL